PSMASSNNFHRNIIRSCGEHRNFTGCSAVLTEAAPLRQTSLKDCAEIAMKFDELKQRQTPLQLSSQEFRTLGYRLVDRIAGHFETLANRRVTPGEAPEAVRRAIGSDNSLPVSGTEAGPLLDEITNVLLEHSLFNAHPRFWGYITAGPAPIGVLAD